MASITFGGLASGLDTNSIVTQLMQLERKPIENLQNDRNYLTSRLSAFSNFDGKLKKLLSAFQAIDTTDELRSYTAKAANDEYFSFTASSTASKGDYDIEVVSLAQVQKDVSSGYSNADATGFSAGTISINGTDIPIDDGASLSQVVDSINAANSGDSATGVSAALINDGTANGYRIVLTGKDAATTFDATISGVSAEGTDLSFNNTQIAKQASVKVDNITIVSNNNVITGAIPGVTLNLQKTNAASEKTHLSVDVDTEAISGKIKNMVDAYNGIINFIADQKDASWANDSGMKNVKRAIQNLLVTSVGGTGNFQHLVDLGFSTNKDDGTLSFSSTTLNDALNNDLDSVEKLFVGEDGVEGIAAKFSSYLESMTDSKNGIYASRKASTDSSIRSLDDNIARMEDRLSKREETMRSQFNALELLMSQMNSTSSYLSQQMTMISNLSSGANK